MGERGELTPEQMGLKLEETRVLNDAELIKGGARADDQGRLEVTKAQLNEAKLEMMEDQDYVPIHDLDNIFFHMDAWLKEAEEGKNVSNSVDSAGTKNAIAEYIISRLSSEERRKADEYFETRALNGNTMDEKFKDLQKRLYEARRRGESKKAGSWVR